MIRPADTHAATTANGSGTSKQSTTTIMSTPSTVTVTNHRNGSNDNDIPELALPDFVRSASVPLSRAGGHEMGALNNIPSFGPNGMHTLVDAPTPTATATATAAGFGAGGSVGHLLSPTSGPLATSSSQTTSPQNEISTPLVRPVASDMIPSTEPRLMGSSARRAGLRNTFDPATLGSARLLSGNVFASAFALGADSLDASASTTSTTASTHADAAAATAADADTADVGTSLSSSTGAGKSSAPLSVAESRRDHTTHTTRNMPLRSLVEGDGNDNDDGNGEDGDGSYDDFDDPYAGAAPSRDGLRIQSDVLRRTGPAVLLGVEQFRRMQQQEMHSREDTTTSESMNSVNRIRGDKHSLLNPRRAGGREGDTSDLLATPMPHKSDRISQDDSSSAIRGGGTVGMALSTANPNHVAPASEARPHPTSSSSSSSSSSSLRSPVISGTGKPHGSTALPPMFMTPQIGTNRLRLSVRGEEEVNDASSSMHADLLQSNPKVGGADGSGLNSSTGAGAGAGADVNTAAARFARMHSRGASGLHSTAAKSMGGESGNPSPRKPVMLLRHYPSHYPSSNSVRNDASSTSAESKTAVQLPQSQEPSNKPSENQEAPLKSPTKPRKDRYAPISSSDYGFSSPSSSSSQLASQLPSPLPADDPIVELHGLSAIMQRQSQLLHGAEADKLKYTPRILAAVAECLYASLCVNAIPFAQGLSGPGLDSTAALFSMAPIPAQLRGSGGAGGGMGGLGTLATRRVARADILASVRPFLNTTLGYKSGAPAITTPTAANATANKSGANAGGGASVTAIPIMNTIANTNVNANANVGSAAASVPRAEALSFLTVPAGTDSCIDSWAMQFTTGLRAPILLYSGDRMTFFSPIAAAASAAPAAGAGGSSSLHGGTLSARSTVVGFHFDQSTSLHMTALKEGDKEEQRPSAPQTRATPTLLANSKTASTATTSTSAKAATNKDKKVDKDKTKEKDAEATKVKKSSEKGGGRRSSIGNASVAKIAVNAADAKKKKGPPSPHATKQSTTTAKPAAPSALSSSSSFPTSTASPPIPPFSHSSSPSFETSTPALRRPGSPTLSSSSFGSSGVPDSGRRATGGIAASGANANNSGNGSGGGAGGARMGPTAAGNASSLSEGIREPPRALKWDMRCEAYICFLKARINVGDLAVLQSCIGWEEEETTSSSSSSTEPQSARMSQGRPRSTTIGEFMSSTTLQQAPPYASPATFIGYNKNLRVRADSMNMDDDFFFRRDSAAAGYPTATGGSSQPKYISGALYILAIGIDFLDDLPEPIVDLPVDLHEAAIKVFRECSSSSPSSASSSARTQCVSLLSQAQASALSDPTSSSSSSSSSASSHQSSSASLASVMTTTKDEEPWWIPSIGVHELCVENPHAWGTLAQAARIIALFTHSLGDVVQPFDIGAGLGGNDGVNGSNNQSTEAKSASPSSSSSSSEAPSVLPKLPRRITRSNVAARVNHPEVRARVERTVKAILFPSSPYTASIAEPRMRLVLRLAYSLTHTAILHPSAHASYADLLSACSSAALQVARDQGSMTSAAQIAPATFTAGATGGAEGAGGAGGAPLPSPSPTYSPMSPITATLRLRPLNLNAPPPLPEHGTNNGHMQATSSHLAATRNDNIVSSKAGMVTPGLYSSLHPATHAGAEHTSMPLLHHRLSHGSLAGSVYEEPAAPERPVCFEQVVGAWIVYWMVELACSLAPHGYVPL